MELQCIGVGDLKPSRTRGGELPRTRVNQAENNAMPVRRLILDNERLRLGKPSHETNPRAASPISADERRVSIAALSLLRTSVHSFHRLLRAPQVSRGRQSGHKTPRAAMPQSSRAACAEARQPASRSESGPMNLVALLVSVLADLCKHIPLPARS